MALGAPLALAAFALRFWLAFPLTVSAEVLALRFTSSLLHPLPLIVGVLLAVAAAWLPFRWIAARRPEAGPLLFAVAVAMLGLWIHELALEMRWSFARGAGTVSIPVASALLLGAALAWAASVAAGAPLAWAAPRWLGALGGGLALLAVHLVASAHALHSRDCTLFEVILLHQVVKSGPTDGEYLSRLRDVSATQTQCTRRGPTLGFFSGLPDAQGISLFRRPL